MIAGTVAGACTGAAIPAMNILFGMIIDDLNTNPDSMAKQIADLCVALATLAFINFICGFLQVSVLESHVSKRHYGTTFRFTAGR